MSDIQVQTERLSSFVKREEMDQLKVKAQQSNEALHKKSGKGNDFLGWLELPSSINDKVLAEMEETAKPLRGKIDILLVIGIGGSYLGAKAVNDALSDNFPGFSEQKNPAMIFAGHQICEDYTAELLQLLDKKSYAIVVISKSGTTTEPAIAFRLFKTHLETKVGKEEARKRIIAITDANKGALKQVAVDEGYKCYVIPDDVGGRYSVLTPVGLVPLSICGFDIRSLVQGAQKMERITSPDTPVENNPVCQYAMARNTLYNKGKKIEIMVNYHSKLHYLAEWWKQLYGESEGKEGKGIFPAAVDNSSDLHSMGQYIQEGERMLFETVISIASSNKKVIIPKDEKNLDTLNFLSGKRIDEVNKMAELGTILAHIDGDVPNIRIEMPELNAYYLGQLMYFFEKACGISGYILGINPFDQPGVEAYKKNMFALLEKPGFEEETKQLKKRL